MKKFNFDFVKHFNITVIVSAALVLGSLFIIVSKGMNFGVDFRGGAEIQVKFDSAVSDSEIRTALKKTNFNVSSIQPIGEDGGNEFLIKVGATEKDINKVTQVLTTQLGTSFAGKGLEIRKTDIVGPKAGKQLQYSGLYAMLIAMGAILLYIGLRFDFKYAPGAVVALFHDVIIICGVFALFNIEFSLQIVGALLAVIGYSVNDTVVVYDRVREHEEKAPLVKLGKHINRALNETLTRTMWTSMTTLFVALSMFLFGGGIIHNFFLAIVLGVIVGTYSSLYVAAPTVLFLSKYIKD